MKIFLQHFSYKKMLLWGSIIFLWSFFTGLWVFLYAKKKYIYEMTTYLTQRTMLSQNILLFLRKHDEVHSKKFMTIYTKKNLASLFHAWANQHSLHHVDIKISSEKSFVAHAMMVVTIIAESENDEYCRDFLKTSFTKFPGSLVVQKFSIEKKNSPFFSPMLYMKLTVLCMVCIEKKKSIGDKHV